MLNKKVFPRAKAQYSRKDSTAQLRSPDGTVAVMLKLNRHNELIVEFFRKTGETFERFHREFSPHLNWDD